MPGRVWEQAFEVALDQYGFITFEDMRDIDADPARLRQWHQAGKIERRGHGIYRFQQIPATELDSYMLATLWPSRHGVLGYDTALELHALCDVNPEKVHIVVPAGYRVSRKGGENYVLHKENLDEKDKAWHEGIPIVTPAKAIEQAIRGAVPTHLIRQAIETAARLGRVPAPELEKLKHVLEERQ